MNKQILAAAITAGLMAPGLTTADIKIFGQIQAETGTLDRSGAGEAEFTRSGNVLGSIKGGGLNAFGIMGDEKLGNGLTAYFKLNNGFSTFKGSTDNSKGGGSSGNIVARDRYVGLKGDGWHVQFGRMNTLYKTASHRYDPFLGTGLQSRANGGMSGAHNGFFNDVARFGFKSGSLSGGIDVKWEDAHGEDDTGITPQGFGSGCARTTTATVNNNNTPNDPSDDTVRAVNNNTPTRSSCTNISRLNDVESGSFTTAIKYGEKNWEVGLAYLNIGYDSARDADDDGGEADSWKVHGKYDFGDFTLNAQYERLDASDEAVEQIQYGDRVHRGDGNSTLLGGEVDTGNRTAEGYSSLHLVATYKVSDNTQLIGRYASTEWEDITMTDTSPTRPIVTTPGGDAEGSHWAVGLKHGLSKRTSVYGGYMDNEYEFDNKEHDFEIDGWAIGMLHKF